MEVFSSSILSKPHIFSAISPLTPPSSLTTLCKKTPFKFRQTQLKSFPNSPFLTTSPNRNRKIIPIVARFGRPTKRRNSLRKKLTSGGDLQVRQNPQKFIDPVHHFVDNQENDSILSVDSLERGSGELGGNSNLENSRQFGESVLWNKLEGWVEQYKNDIEFWGIGSNPIFTVFQDSSGNVKRVLVDEDEILRRNGVEPLYFKGKELGDFGDAILKILHAKNLAKEVEDGNNVIPRNSSVAKFVVSGEKLGFVSTIKSIFVPQYSLAKVSRIGIAMVCGFVFVWVIKKIFTLQAKEPELTGLEKEMLRRKMKSRLVTEKLKKGSIEIVEVPSDSLTVFTERPRLDKEAILNNIREAKGLNNSLVVPNVGGAQETASSEMDIKIREIQIMARHARKIGRGEGIPSEEDEFHKQVIPNKLQLVEEDAVEGSKDSNALSSVEKDVSDEFAGADKNPSNDLHNENSAEPRFVHGISETEILGNLKMQSSDVSFTSEKVYEEHEDVEPHNSLSRKITDDEKTNINGLLQSHEISNSSNLTEGIQSYIYSSKLNSSKKTPLRRKPKIIRSVKEARGYLLHKHNSMDQEGDIPTAAAVNDKGMDNSFSQRSGEEDETPESFDVGSIVPALKVSGRCNANELLATDTNALRVTTESELKQKRPDDLSSAENSGVGLNMGTTMKIDGISKHSVSHVKLDLVTDENADGSQKSLLTKKSMEEVDELDETVKSTDLSEISDPASGRNGSQVASVFHENAHHDANLNGKIYLSSDSGKVSLGESNEIPKPTEQSKILVPAAVGRNRDRCDTEDNAFLPIDINDDEREYGNHQEESKHLTTDTLKGSSNGVDGKDEALFAEKENWLEKNFHEVEPIVKTIGSGFRNNYNVAREKIKQEVNSQLDLTKLRSMKDDTELEWMKDDKLREIVFKVRDNELAGRDPFDSMDAGDKVAFFKGLESKVEKENQKLSTLHEWLHSNIENLDYGADGISLYDPPEKVIPRWKGPPLDTIPEFLNNSRDQQQVESSLQKVNEFTNHDNVETSLEASSSKSTRKEKDAKFTKTVIEASDGSIKPGKRSGKEYWQHTKKYTRGFVESYNAETDPEVKSVMKDIGKDLDRWITEKEIQDAADLMDKIPQKGKEIIEKKLNKLKREMELFGPQAVVSKYREYAEEKEEDYLWWLDLPHLLCIELYTYDGVDQRVGFYSLEMAADLELEPKPNHVIAFEDPGDSKNFCYILQAHLEMIGKGKAFIVPQPPKDVFRQAKANGFGVTVIRKGELKLNIDQALEEVEEFICEIGSKMYHDKITRERSVDISSLMKGVFGVSPPSKRKRKKRARKRPSKS